MADEVIYRKTEKGRTEIATRANKLGMRERSMLIMVDDKTTRAGLLAKNPHPTSEDILNKLLAEDYIESARGTAAAGSVAPPALAPTTVAAATPALAAADQPAVEVSLQSASHYACRTLVTLLGPAADDLTALVEKCKGTEELAARLEKCREVVQAMAGKKKAEEFWAGVRARLPVA